MPAHGRRAKSAGCTAVAALRSRPAACYPHGIRDFHQSILMTAAHSPIKGIALGFLAYFLFSCSDANVKALGGQLPVFEIGFFSTLFAALVLLFLKPRDERWRDADTHAPAGIGRFARRCRGHRRHPRHLCLHHAAVRRGIRAHLPVALHCHDPVDLPSERAGRLAALDGRGYRFRRRPRDRAAGIRDSGARPPGRLRRLLLRGRHGHHPAHARPDRTARQPAGRRRS